MKHLLAIALVLILLSTIGTKANSLKIVGGDEVEPHSLPFMAVIKTEINDISIVCGGSLVKENVVLTAAKCVDGASEVEITLGAHNIDEDEDSQVVLTSNDFVIHEEYNATTRHNDIALINLPAGVPLSASIALAPLPTAGDIFNSYDEQLGLVAGWGRDNDTTLVHSPVLRKMEVVIIPLLMCEISYFFGLSTSQMCTIGTLGKGICLGDNGGPLMVNGTQVGIASFGNDFACSAGFPSVYTRLTSYLLWLSTHLS
ncbi:brachyurin [Aethina tumida]|uniref:brachyurin n=1 Tax=Aethina tumida TaxID=116153 RepID=UPI00214963F0|nr:brachyurin [Aethina tumida]XP_049826371.1 brachyurin [Aethina tumida]